MLCIYIQQNILLCASFEKFSATFPIILSLTLIYL